MIRDLTYTFHFRHSLAVIRVHPLINTRNVQSAKSSGDWGIRVHSQSHSAAAATKGQLPGQGNCQIPQEPQEGGPTVEVVRKSKVSLTCLS